MQIHIELDYGTMGLDFVGSGGQGGAFVPMVLYVVLGSQVLWCMEQQSSLSPTCILLTWVCNIILFVCFC